MLTFGIFTGAIAFNQKNEMTHASRDSARYGATLSLTQQFDGSCNPTFDGSGTASGSCWAQNVAKDARTNAYGNLDTSIPGQHVCVAVVQGTNSVYVDPVNGTYWYDSNGGSPAPCFNDGGADQSVRVQVVTGRNAYINAVLFRMNFTVGSQATAQIETQPVASPSPSPSAT